MNVVELDGSVYEQTFYHLERMFFVELLQPEDFLDAWAEASYRYGNAYVHEWSLLSNKQKERIRERAN